MPSEYQHKLDEINKLLKESMARDMHPLRVYRPTEWQQPIHQSKSEEILITGGKRSGKTLATVMEVGSRILGIPITGCDGKVIPLRYRKPTEDAPTLFWVIGLNVDHIGQTLYHRLFSPGLGCDFKIIKDNGIWRAYNPVHDSARESEAVVCPPMIQDNMIVEGTWHMESAAGNIFKSVRLKNGATICAYPSTGDRPKMGDAVHGIWIDEDIANANFIKEWQDRLITANGWLLWSVWPQMSNFALIDAMDRAESCKEDPDPAIQVFSLQGSKNPYNDPKGVMRGLARMDDNEDEAHRDRGDISGLMGNYKMYDYAPKLHNLGRVDNHNKKCHEPRELLESILFKYGKFPDSWTRYLVIDPSHTRTAVLFGVVPPREWEHVEIGDKLIVENELVCSKHTPSMLVNALAPLCSGLHFEAFIMDQQAGRQTTIGAEMSTFESYSKQFAKHGLSARVCGNGFLRGCNEKQRRRRAVRELLEPIEGGLPKLMLREDKTYATQREFHRYRKKQQPGQKGDEPMDDPLNERAFDCMAALEYLCEYVQKRFSDGTAFMEPEARKGQGSPAFQAAQRILSKQNEVHGYAHLGAGAAA